MTKLFLQSLTLKATIGIHEWERRIPQTLIIDLDMHVNTEQAAANNDIEQTTNYQAVAERIRQFFSDETFNIVENAAERLATLLLTEFTTIQWLRLRLSKPNIFSDVAAAGIEIERGVKP